MDFNQTIMIYFLVGTMWCWFLEYYTTKYFEGKMGEPLTWKERAFHILLWPVSFSYFIYTFIKEVW